MQPNLNNDGLGINFVIGCDNVVEQMHTIPVKKPFDESVMIFLNEVSKVLLSNSLAKKYPDVVTFAFWIRKSSLQRMKERFFAEENERIRLGRGTLFHIAPSNVPVNYAYSLATGLICGNRNIVRIPSKEFEQVKIINTAIKEVLEKMQDFRPYICLVQYGHSSEVNDKLSGLADVRIIWGGDRTIEEIRKSPLKARATEVAFADRFSLAVISSEDYLAIENKEKVASDFYNDTFLTDQNACTSPRAVVWMGNRIEDAKELFWNNLHVLVKDKYHLSGIQAVNKLTSSYLLAAAKDEIRKINGPDNYITRIAVKTLTSDLMRYKDNSGYFLEYDCRSIQELVAFCNDSGCQTLSYLGNKSMFMPLMEQGIAGIDRVVPIGKTMDFDLIWDGYNLFERLTRIISIR